MVIQSCKNILCRHRDSVSLQVFTNLLADLYILDTKCAIRMCWTRILLTKGLFNSRCINPLDSCADTHECITREFLLPIAELMSITQILQHAMCYLMRTDKRERLFVMNTHLKHLVTAESKNIIVKCCWIIGIYTSAVIHLDVKVIHVEKSTGIMKSCFYHIIRQAVLVCNIVEMTQSIRINSMVEVKRRVISCCINMCVHNLYCI